LPSSHRIGVLLRRRQGIADPTNRTLAGETHVKIGHGRFYGDVPPIKGV
jgi:hypothetical protein